MSYGQRKESFDPGREYATETTVLPSPDSPIPYKVSRLSIGSTWRGRFHEYLRTAMGYSILGLFMLAAQWYNSGLTLVERGRQVRKDNEMLAISWLPDPPKSARYVPSDAVVVRPMDLARSYHDSKRAADYAYNEQTITLCIRGYVVRDRAIHWHLGDQNIPALVVMELAEGEKIPATALNRTLWVTGRCEGRMDDGVKRDYDYPFHVRVTACRAVLE